MIGRYPSGSILIGKGESRNLIINITDKNSVLSNLDTILFAMKNTDCDIAVEKSKKVEELTKDKDTYTFIVEFSSNDTIQLELGLYFYDITLIRENGEKISLTDVRTIEIVKTVGASIGG